MDYPFKPGDRVRLSREGAIHYGGVWPQFIPQAQGGGTAGTVLVAEDRPHRPGAAPRPYYVLWDNGVENSYRIEDLVADADPEPGPPSNVVPFRPRA